MLPYPCGRAVSPAIEAAVGLVEDAAVVLAVDRPPPGVPR